MLDNEQQLSRTPAEVLWSTLEHGKPSDL